MKKLFNQLPIQWWVEDMIPAIIVTPLRLSRPASFRWHKTTWWNVLTGKHCGNKLKLTKP